MNTQRNIVSKYFASGLFMFYTYRLEHTQQLKSVRCEKSSIPKELHDNAFA